MRIVIIGLLLICGFSYIAQGRYVNGVNWADRVVSHTDKIQSWADGQCGGSGSMSMQMETPATTWLVLGQSDADAAIDPNGAGDMYAWDFENGDKDYVAGWRGSSPSATAQEIVVKFDIGIRDVSGNDLVIRMFGGPAAACSVWASTDGANYIQIGTITGEFNGIPGEGGYLYDAEFDFDGQLIGDVHYVRVFREITAAQSGMFFDSFRAAYIDLPTTTEEVSLFGWTLVGDVDEDCYVDLRDFAILHSYWMTCNDPESVDFDLALFADPTTIPSTCHGVWQSGMGLKSDMNHDCETDILDLHIFASQFLQCNDPQNTACQISW